MHDWLIFLAVVRQDARALHVLLCVLSDMNLLLSPLAALSDYADSDTDLLCIRSGPRALLPIELLQCIVHEPPPRLSDDSFSPEFCDFTARQVVSCLSLRAARCCCTLVNSLSHL